MVGEGWKSRSVASVASVSSKRISIFAQYGELHSVGCRLEWNQGADWGCTFIFRCAVQWIGSRKAWIGPQPGQGKIYELELKGVDPTYNTDTECWAGVCTLPRCRCRVKKIERDSWQHCRSFFYYWSGLSHSCGADDILNFSIHLLKISTETMIS